MAVGIIRHAAHEAVRRQTHVLDRRAGNAPTTPRALSLSLHVSTDYGSGYIVFAGDGTAEQLTLPAWRHTANPRGAG